MQTGIVGGIKLVSFIVVIIISHFSAMDGRVSYVHC